MLELKRNEFIIFDKVKKKIINRLFTSIFLRCHLVTLLCKAREKKTQNFYLIVWKISRKYTHTHTHPHIQQYSSVQIWLLIFFSSFNESFGFEYAIGVNWKPNNKKKKSTHIFPTWTFVVVDDFSTVRIEKSYDGTIVTNNFSSLMQITLCIFILLWTLPLDANENT